MTTKSLEEEIQNILKYATREDIAKLYKVIVVRGEMLRLQVAAQINEGDRVEFNARDGKLRKGILLSIGGKNAKVRVDNGWNWRVSILLLRPEAK